MTLTITPLTVGLNGVRATWEDKIWTLTPPRLSGNIPDIICLCLFPSSISTDQQTDIVFDQMHVKYFWIMTSICENIVL